MRLVFSAVYVFMGLLLFAVPNMTRRELLFAVPVPPDFRNSPEGRRAIFKFRAAIAVAVLVGVCVLLMSPIEILGAIAPIAPAAIFLTGIVSFYQQYRTLAPAAVQFSRASVAELSAAPDRLPAFTWFAIGPFVILATAATWLYLNWERIPARFPVHFDIAGQPDHWVDRTVKGVYGPLFLAAELCAFFAIMALAGWFGSRRSHSRSVMLGAIITVEYLIGILFALIAVQAPLGIPIWTIAIFPMVILIPLIIVVIQKMSDPADPVDPTPNECWKGAIFYYNPDDAALFVEKRDGFGYTFNFGNRWSWVLLLCLALVIASGPFVLATT